MKCRRSILYVLVLVVVAFSLVLLQGGPCFAKKMTLKVSHQFAPGDVRDKMVRVYGDKITALTNGEITFRYYPAKALFKPLEQWDAMRKGLLDLAVFPLSYASGKVPQLDITLMPCLFATQEQGMSWRNKPIGKKIEALMLENGVRNLIWAWFDGGLGSTVRQIKLPGDVKGLKMRAAGKMFEYMLRESGSSIVSMPSSEIYHALTTGVLTAAMTSSASFVSYRLYEPLKYLNAPVKNCIWFMSENVTISEITWKKLTKKQQKIFMDVAEEMHQTWIIPNFAKLVGTLVEKYEGAGVKVHQMTDSEFEVWREFAKKTSWKHFTDKVEGGQELLDMAAEASK